MPTPTSGSAVDPVERERRAAEFLDTWPWELGAVLMGGYAVAAHGLARHSVDVDFVIAGTTRAAHSNFLRAAGFAGRELRFRSDTPSTLVVERWERPPMTLDVLVGGVRDRKAQVDVPAEWIQRDPWRGQLPLLASRTQVEVAVCRPTALFVLKLLAGRRQDLADMLTMEVAVVEVAEARSLFKSLWCESLDAKFTLVRRLLDDPKTYRDVCSHRALGSPERRDNIRRWRKLSERVAACLPEG